MTSLFSDTFTGTSGTELSLHTSDSGHSWAKVVGTPTLNISSANRLRDNGTGAARYRATLTSAVADQIGTAIIRKVSALGVAGPIVRYQAAADTGYVVAYTVSTDQWDLYRFVAGVFSASLGSYSEAAGWGVGTDRTVKLAVSGTGATVTLTVTINGTQRITYSDTDAARVTAAGHCGVHLQASTTTNFDTRSLHIDSLSVTDNTPQTVTPTTAALTTTTFAPTVLAPRVVAPATAALTTATFAPTVVAGGGGGPVTVTPTTAALTTATFAPTARTPRVAIPDTRALTAATFAPAILTPRVAIPATAALTTATFAPAVRTPRVAIPTTAALTTATFAPIVAAGGGITVTPTTRALLLTPYAPIVAVPLPDVRATLTGGMIALGGVTGGLRALGDTAGVGHAAGGVASGGASGGAGGVVSVAVPVGSVTGGAS